MLNTALITATSGLSPAAARADGTFHGRLVESAVGAHLATSAATGECDLLDWREGGREVDFVLLVGGGIPLSEFLATPVTSWANPGRAAP